LETGVPVVQAVVVLSREAEIVAPLTLFAEGVRASFVRARTPKPPVSGELLGLA
jgi:hypothetical protein